MKPVVAKPAATIMLGREHEGELEVLLLKRNKALKFAGGLWVFPGGKIEPEEIEASENDLEAAKVAAVRETEEESQIRIEKEELIFFRHWTTPENEPRRYATWFFFAPVDQEDLIVQVDDSEIKDHLWINPQKALEAYRDGEIHMMPPTVFCLQIIRTCESLGEALEKLKQEEPIFVLPVVQLEGTKVTIMYDGDAGYESGDASVSGPRHRWIMDMSSRSYSFEYEGCEEFIPANGGDDFFT